MHNWRTAGRVFFINFLILLAALGAGIAVSAWRQAQYRGYGLAATYYSRADFSGTVWRHGIEPVLDFSDKRQPHFDHDEFSAQWTGTIVLPEDGRYAFALESDDGSTLELDGQLIVDNAGSHGLRRVEAVRYLKGGAHAIRLRYSQLGLGAIFRWQWTTNHRWGVFEKIPPTILFPQPPEQAPINRAQLTAPRDAWTALAYLLLFLAVVLGWSRAAIRRGISHLRTNSATHYTVLLFFILTLAALGIRLYDLGGAGQLWDEDTYFSASRNFLQNLLDFDWRHEIWTANKEHPAMGKWSYSFASSFTESFNSARAMAALMGALSCGVLFLLGRRLFSYRVGIFSALLSMLLPHLIAHQKIVGLETPSAFFMLLSLYLLVEGLEQKNNSWLHIFAGLCAGAAISVRYTNISIIGILTIVYLARHYKKIVEERRFFLPLTLGLAPLCALLFFFFCWPFVWKNPLQSLGVSLSARGTEVFSEYWRGLYTDKFPWYYFFNYFFVTTPIGVLLAWLCFWPAALLRRSYGYFVAGTFFLLPFAVSFSPVVQDGLRYIFPALLGACLCAGLGLDWLCSVITKLFKPTSRARLFIAPTLATLLTVYLLLVNLRAHPFYLDYYNELAGGARRVNEKNLFDFSWWGEGLNQAADFINRDAAPSATVNLQSEPIHVVALRLDIRKIDQQQADYIVYNKSSGVPARLTPEHRLAFEVKTQGAPLIAVYKKFAR